MATAELALGWQAHSVYEDLRGQVVQGVMAPGERLPTQRTLANSYGVSINTITKVISQLQEEKLVLAKRGAGVFVRRKQTPVTESRLISYMYMQDGENLVPVQRAALNRGYLLSVFSQVQSKWDVQAERLFLQQVLEQQHQALLAFCSPTEPHNDDLLRELAVSGIRVIHVDHYRPEPPEQSYILPDYRKAASMAAVDLMVAGYERIFFYGHPDGESPSTHFVHQGLFDARDDFRAAVKEDYLIRVPRHDEFPVYQEGVAKLLKRVPANSGIVVLGSDRVNTVKRGLESNGYRIPEDVGLIAVDLPWHPPSNVDRMAFDRQSIIEQAMDAAIADEDPNLRLMVRPERVSGGTVRSPQYGA